MSGLLGSAPQPTWMPEGGPDQVARQVAAVVQVVHDPDEADRVDVVDRGRVRVVAELRRVAGDGQDVAQAERVGARAGPTGSRAGSGRGRCSGGWCRSPPCVCMRTHRAWALMRAEARGPSATLIASTSLLLAELGAARGSRPGSAPLGGSSSTETTNCFPSLRASADLLLARDRGGRLLGARRAAGPSRPPRAGCSMRTERTRFLMWAGVVPQQPPTTVTPARDEAPRVGGHVLGRAEVDVAAVHEGGRARVGHGRELRARAPPRPCAGRSPASAAGPGCSWRRPRRRPSPRGSRTTSSGVSP